MRVVTFNVRHGLTPAGRVDVGLLARTCASFGADVLGLQEVDRWMARSGNVDIAAHVARACGMTEAFGTAVRFGRRGRYGVALFVRGGLAHVETLPLPRFGRREPRVALLATAETAEAYVSVAVCHLGTDRAESAAQLAELLDALEDRPPPRLLLGDLNRTPEELGALTDAGFVVVGGPPTWPADAPVARLDHVAVNGLVVAAVSVPAVPVSDHRPVVVDLVVPAAG